MSNLSHLPAAAVAFIGRLAWSASSAAIGLALAIQPALAGTGDLDTTFGPYGSGWGESIGQLYNFVALDGVVLPDDRVVVGGACPSHATSPLPGTVFCIAVWSAAGGNAVMYPIYNNANRKVISSANGAVARQRDGKILLTAPCEPDDVLTISTLCLMRFNADFSRDTLFATSSASNVATTVIHTNNSYSSAVAIQPDGKIVIAGQCGTGAGTVMCVARFLANGDRDTPFGGSHNLRALTGVHSPAFDRARGIVILPSGKIMLGGDCRNTDGFSYPCAARINEDGSIDTSFNAGSSAPRLLLAGIGANDDFMADMKIQANGELLLAGHCNNSGSGQRVPCALRFQQDGSAGTPFFGASQFVGSSKLLELNAGGSFRIDRLFMQADGKFLAAMFDYTAVQAEANRTTRIRRYNEDGSLDANWHQQGIQYQYNVGWTVALGQQSNGKIIMMGSSDQKVRIARLDNRPSTGRGCDMDVDGDGVVSPTTDGLLLARVAAGMTGNAVIAGAVGAGARRNSWPLIRDHLILQCGMSTVKP